MHPFPLNNPAVSLATRKWLTALAQAGRLLDPPSLRLISPAVERCAPVHPGGLILDISTALGAPHDKGLVAGSAAELFYAACSLTDDIQDGDSDDYYDSVPLRLQINAQTHLFGLVSLRVAELASSLPSKTAFELAIVPFRTLAAMLTGQRLEIARDSWSIAACERVARLSAGEQAAMYMRLAAAAADMEGDHLADWGRAVGACLQMAADFESSDSRITSLPREQIDELCYLFLSELTDAARKLPPSLYRFTEGIRRRCLDRQHDKAFGPPS